MQEYLRIVKEVATKGVRKANRTGMDAITVPGMMFEHDMQLGFPLLTTKRVLFRRVATELEFFIKGLTDKRWLQERGNHIWDNWSSSVQAPACATREEQLLWQQENNDMGPLGYSHQWRHFGGDYTPLPFAWSGLDRSIDVIPSKESLVGSVIPGKYGMYTVVSYDGKDAYFNKRFTVKFHATGFTKSGLNSSQITSTAVWDPYHPEICGVACMGEYTSELPESVVDSLKNSWRQMIHRCYSTEHPAYHKYGGKGVYVANRWLIFANFLSDVQRIDGWSAKLANWEEYQLDKDISGKRCYSVDSCVWCTRSDNGSCTSQNFLFDAKDPNGKIYRNQVGLARFCRAHGLDADTVGASILAGCSTHGGWVFTKMGPVQVQRNEGVDQLRNLVDQLSTNPNDRRMLVSAWNPVDLHRMALPPCHYAFQVTVIDGALNLLWNQRSVDVAIGLPFNIASYGLLLHLLAKGAGLREGRLIGFLADTHIYVNHIKGLTEQVLRIPRWLPTVTTSGFSGVLSWEQDQTVLHGYDPHPPIPYEIAI